MTLPSLLLLSTLLSRPADAACPAPVGTTAERLQAGDIAWAQGRRGDAACAWRSVSRDPEIADDPALQAMAALRRLRTSGNLGLALRGPRADRALARCPDDDAACALARADRALLVTELGLGDEADRAALWAAEAARLDPAAREAALVRTVLAGGAPLDALAAVAEDSPVAAALLETGGGTPSPGSWTLGLGVVGAPVLGAGPVLRFVHPDLAWRGWRFEAEGYATTGGASRLAAGLRTSGRTWLTTGLAGSRLLVPVFDESGELLVVDDVLALQLRAAPGLSVGPVALWLGPQLRLDQPTGTDSWQPGHGLFGGLGLAGGHTVVARALLTSESALIGATHLDGTLDLGLWHPGAWGATVAWRAVGTGNPLESEDGDSGDVWRRPAWGGGEVLRSVPLGRFREAWMGALVSEWRQPLVGILGLTLFGEAGWAGELVAGGGGGLRLHLPPRPPTTVRLDVAAGTAGWALTAGWGESF